MKQNKIYVLTGITALLISTFLLASMFYKKSEEKSATPSASPTTAAIADLQAPYLGAADRTQGPSAARIMLVEFLDPQCESCRLMHPITKKILANFPGQIYYVLRYMPLHPNSVYAISILEAAARQGKFWEALDVVFAKQEKWGSGDKAKPELILTELGAIGLNRGRLEIDSKDPEIAKKIEHDKTDGIRLGVNGTPTYFINGQMLEKLGEAPLRDAIRQQIGTP